MKNRKNANGGAQVIAVVLMLAFGFWLVRGVGDWVGSLPVSPTPNAPNFGQKVETADEWVVLPEGVQFRRCPLMSCGVVATAGEDTRALIIRLESGEVVRGIELWAVARIDDNEVYAPMADVFPQDDVTAEATLGN